MEIKGKVWCMFEQSGTFKNEFKKLGYDAVDLDIQNNFGEPVYKRGDNVWYFDNEGFPTICHCDITEVSIKKGHFPLYYVFEKSGRRIGWLPGHILFPSREALCEHYRKIFE